MESASNDLFLAVKIYGNETVVNELLQNGADVNTCDNITKNTALHIACYNNNEDIISCLLRSGADISAINVDGKTPFSVLLESPDSELSDYHFTHSVIAMVQEFAKLEYANISIFRFD